jgi:hypothetical protein
MSKDEANPTTEKSSVVQPAPMQEPVATGDTLFRQFMSEAEKAGVTHWPTPPAAQRPWVGLTDDGYHQIIADWMKANGSYRELCEAIEAELKELNA